MTRNAYFWLITGTFMLPCVLGMPVSWFAGYLAAFAVASVFVIPLFICRHCPSWNNGRLYLTCCHYGVPKVYSYCDRPLSSGQRLYVFAGFAAIFGSGTLLVTAAGSYALAACAGYAAIAWLATMRRTLCLTCSNVSCPMK